MKSILPKLAFICSLVVLLEPNKRVANALTCYSCSTKAGDTFCSEDTFDGKKIAAISCPTDADVCVKITKLSDGSIFRSCGTSSSAAHPELTHFGFYPLKNACTNYKASSDSKYPESEFEICACADDLSNTRGKMKCDSSSKKK